MARWALVGGIVALALLVVVIFVGALSTPRESYGWKIYQGKGDSLALVAHSPEREFNATFNFSMNRGPIQAAYAPVAAGNVTLSWTGSANPVTVRSPAGERACAMTATSCDLSLSLSGGGEIAWVLGVTQGNVTFVAARTT